MMLMMKRWLMLMVVGVMLGGVGGVAGCAMDDDVTVSEGAKKGTGGEGEGTGLNAQVVSHDVVLKDVQEILSEKNTENIRKHFEVAVRKRSDQLAKIKTLDEWKAKRGEMKEELLEMFGLSPIPKRGDLKITFTGSETHEDIVVHKLHFQSLPGLYVTGNLYMPQKVEGKLPGVLYVCGHGQVKIKGVSYGNKVHYQHHGAWFAKNGYVCLVIDSLQLGEIEGIHHGTHRYDMWWWLNRGYSPAGVEALNCIRALDVLQSIDDVDKERLGVTGRSGGGAYSWFVAALDERVKAAVPVAGITDLEDHVVHDCVEGHCDCMFFHNTYAWDYPMLAAMVAPRALLISNTDKDSIFPLRGVIHTHKLVKHIYGLYDAEKKLGLHIVDGPHSDTQKLRIHAFTWMNRFLKDDTGSVIVDAGEKPFSPEQLRVFKTLPEDEINTNIQEVFVKPGVAKQPKSDEDWEVIRREWMHFLKAQVFRGWDWDAFDKVPEAEVVYSKQSMPNDVRVIEFEAEAHVPIRMVALRGQVTRARNAVTLKICGPGELSKRVAEGIDKSGGQVVYMAPRGDGLTSWEPKRKGRERDLRRRYALLGQTQHGMQVYDVVKALQVIRAKFGENVSVRIEGEGVYGAIGLYAAIFSDVNVRELKLKDLPERHRGGPYLMNIRKGMDMPQAVLLGSAKARVTFEGDTGAYWAKKLEEMKW